MWRSTKLDAAKRPPRRSRKKSKNGRRSAPLLPALAAPSGRRRQLPDGDPAAAKIRRFQRHSAVEIREFAKVCAKIRSDNHCMGTQLRSTTDKLDRLSAVIDARQQGFVPPLAVAKRSARYSALQPLPGRTRRMRKSATRIPCPSGTLSFDPDGDAVRARRAQSAGVIPPPTVSDDAGALKCSSTWVYLPYSPKRPHSVDCDAAGNREAAPGGGSQHPNRGPDDAASPSSLGRASEGSSSPMSATCTPPRIQDRIDAHEPRGLPQHGSADELETSTASMVGTSELFPVMDWCA